MKFYIIALFLFVSIANCYALGVADFVPGFLVPTRINESSGADDTIPVKPLVDVKRNSSQTSWYCRRAQANGTASNVFCNKNSSSAVAHVLNYESNPNADQSKVVDNSVSGNNKSNLNTSSNQNTLQDQQLKNAMDKNKNNFSVPIQPSKDVKMNINSQQVQFNIQY